MPTFWKGEPRRRLVDREKRVHVRARRACVLAVWQRAGNRCERCGQAVVMASTFYRAVGHVHETIGRSGGADPTDPAQCELLCYGCHFGGPSGAHVGRRK